MQYQAMQFQIKQNLPIVVIINGGATHIPHQRQDVKTNPARHSQQAMAQ
jgi:hypothetical protein